MIKELIQRYKEKKNTGLYCRNYTLKDLEVIDREKYEIMWGVFNKNVIRISKIKLLSKSIIVYVYFDDVSNHLQDCQETLDFNKYERGNTSTMYENAERIRITTKDLGEHQGFVSVMKYHLNLYRERKRKENEENCRKQCKEKEELNKVL